MFEINRYKYISKSGNKFEIFARNVDFADGLANRITALGVFQLRRAKIFFCRKMFSEIPPYEVEQEQLATVEKWEANKNG